MPDAPRVLIAGAGPTGLAAALRLAQLAAGHGNADTARAWYEYVCQHWPGCFEALEAGRALRG